MITSLIEQLELPNFGHLTTSTKVAIFADLMKIVTMLIKKIL